MDYWDRLGWKDPFASPKFTERQQRYRRALGMRNLVTPQLLVDNRPAKGSTVAEAAARARERTAPVRIDATASLAEGEVAVTLKLAAVEEDWEAPESAGAVVVLFTRRAVTECTAGENKGRTLEEFFVVLEATDPVPLGDALGKETKRTLKAPKDAKAGDLGVAVLVEDGANMKTLACTWTPVN